MDNTRKFNATVTTRYGAPEKDIYEQVLDLAKTNNLAKSRAQLLLVERGLVHTNNPEPLIKEKMIYKDRVVYKDKPREEHITDDPIKLAGGNDKGQYASDDKLMTPNEANSLLASEVKKSSKDRTGIGGWIGLIAFFVGIPLTGYLWNKYVTKV